MEETYEDYSNSTPVVPNVLKTLGFIFLASFSVGILIQLNTRPFRNSTLSSDIQGFLSSVLGSAVAFMIIPLLIAGFSRGISLIRKQPKSNLTSPLWVSWGIVTAISTIGQFIS